MVMYTISVVEICRLYVPISGIYNLLYSPFRVIYTVPKGKTQRKTEGKDHDERIRTEKPLFPGRLQHRDHPRGFRELLHQDKTKEKVTFTFGGWDGKSYDGESRKASVYRTTIKGFESVRLIKVGKGLHYIEEDHEVLEKATGEYHKRASWLVDVKRA